MNTFSSSDFSAMQAYFSSGATKTYQFRKEQLKKLRRALEKNEVAISEALFKDLRKARVEAFTTEIGFIYAELSHAVKYLQNWMHPQRVSSPIALFPSSSKVIRVPMGVTLIIAPWNYPIQLLLGPLIGAIAGGNCCLLKPSEFTPHTTEVVTKMIEETFDKQYIAIVNGEGAETVQQVMNENRFNHVFFTGSVAVGKEIAKMAAEKLTSATLELGGKSPCVVDRDVNLKVAARRITWGKFTNAGQTCVAPDYLLVHENRKHELLEHMQVCLREFYGTDPLKSPDYGRIINQRRFDKLTAYLHQGTILTGGQFVKEELYIAPTIMNNVDVKHTLMQEEIFGPILPVYTYKDHDEALSLIANNPNPLALYIFTNNTKVERMYSDQVEYGGGCINNTLVHLGNPFLPFGGTGNSGVGAYHGKFSFDTFTRPKAILKTGTWIDPALKYPPFKGKLPLLKWFIR